MISYKLYQSNLIVENHKQFELECKGAYLAITSNLDTKNTTWSFRDYNIFCVTASSIMFYRLYKELNYHIRSYIGDERPLWLQSWLNYDEGDEVERNLQNHGHLSPHHGYISISPQETTTIFNNGLEIKNKVGQIYIGPGRELHNNQDWDHHVKIDRPYTGTRITIGFDILQTPNKVSSPSHIPLL